MSRNGISGCGACETDHVLVCLPAQALFERALGLKETRQSPVLWRAYISYEAAHGRADAAGRVFLRAINACPWAKVGLLSRCR
jgi:hypothetical protein